MISGFWLNWALGLGHLPILGFNQIFHFDRIHKILSILSSSYHHCIVTFTRDLWLTRSDDETASLSIRSRGTLLRSAGKLVTTWEWSLGTRVIMYVFTGKYLTVCYARGTRLCRRPAARPWCMTAPRSPRCRSSGAWWSCPPAAATWPRQRRWWLARTADLHSTH